MNIRTIWIVGVALATVASAAPAQQRRGAAPSPRSPSFAQDLHDIRIHRLQDALELSDETAEALREEMERRREAHREALETRREALRDLRETLSEDPVRESEVARALERLEEHHESIRRLQREHHDRLGEILTPSQRARLLVFNRRFDERLREMLHQRRGERPPVGPRASRRGTDRRSAPPDPGLRGRAPDEPEVRADLLRRRIERMESELERMRTRLRRLESGE